VRRVASFLVLYGISLAAGAALSVSVDRDPVRENESFTISIQMQDAANDQPDLDVLLDDFEILGTSQETRSTIVNRQISNVTAWHVSVMARRDGTLTIPAITVGSQRSEPLQVTVRPATSADDGDREIFLEVEVEPREPYVQQQVLYTVRLVSSVVTADERISEPELPAGEAVVEKLGDRRIYNVQRGERTFRVIESRYALFPQKSGPMTIAAPQCLVRVFDSVGGQWALLSRRPREIRLTDQPITLQVRPVPASYPQDEWLPATSLVLEESISEGPFRVGEPFTRTLGVRAAGLTGGQLPRLPDVDDPALKAYPDRPIMAETLQVSGMVGTREQRSAYIPARQGQLVLPEIRLPWWNTVTDTLEYAVLPARTLEVLAPADQPVPDDTAAPVQPTAQLPTDGAPSPWRWVAALSLAGWMLTALAWAWTGRRSRPGQSTAPAPAPGQVLARLEKACQAGNPGEARQHLERWLAEHLDTGRTAGPEGLQQWLEKNRPTLLARLEELRRCHYGPAPAAWDGAGLLVEIKSLQRDLQARHASGAPSLLAPLNPGAKGP